jgi:hypothetical protein
MRFIMIKLYIIFGHTIFLIMSPAANWSTCIYLFIYDDLSMLTVAWLMKNELERVWKEAIVA